MILTVPLFRRCAWRLAASLLGALALHGAANAGGGPKLVTTVERLQPSVTYANPTSTPPLATFIGYRVTIANTGYKPIGNIRFSGTATVTAAGESAPVASVDGATCTINGSTLDCAIGRLEPGQTSFVVFFNAPAKATGSTLPDGVEGSCPTTDCVAFAGQTTQGDSDDDRWWHPENCATTAWGPVYVKLATANPNSVETAVPKTGGTVFTGNTGQVSAADPLTTTVVVPPGTTFTTAKIVEASTTTQCGVLTTCFTSDVTVPGTFSPYLQIVLRLDGSAVPRGTKIGSILISYDGLVIGDCASPTSPRSDGIPCIAARKTVPSSTSKPPPKPPKHGSYKSHDDDDCDDGVQSFEWTLINTKNGSLKIF